MVMISAKQIEKNVSASFGYVKKDILMVNDAISNVHDKIQHLSLNQAMLVEKMANIEKLLIGKAKPSKVKKAKKVSLKKVKTVKPKATSKKVKSSKKTVKQTKEPKKVITETVLYE